jgi:hypothetical protein
MTNTKMHDIVTFKVDAELREALERVPNRSEFIRSAIRAALKGECPLCRGTGTLTAEERRHWNTFIRHHAVRTCDNCHAVHLVCLEGDDDESQIHGDRH